MHLVRSARPCPALGRYVRAYLQREFRDCPVPVVEPIPARLEEVLQFDFRSRPVLRCGDSNAYPLYRAAIGGYQTWRRSEIVLAGQVESFAVFFQPTAFSRIFGIPPPYLVDQEHEAGGVLGEAVHKLESRMGEAGTFERRVQIMDEFLLRRLAGRLARAGGGHTMARAARRLWTARGIMRISELANEIGMSQRQIERAFLAETGCSPKRYARIARFQAALDMKVVAPDRSWLDVAHSLAYHDQMHMVHDFRALSGSSPDRFLAELGNGRPLAVARG